MVSQVAGVWLASATIQPFRLNRSASYRRVVRGLDGFAEGHTSSSVHLIRETVCRPTPAADDRIRLGGGLLPLLCLGLLARLFGAVSTDTSINAIELHRLVDQWQRLHTQTHLVCGSYHRLQILIAQVELASQPCDGVTELFVGFPLSEAFFQRFA